MNRGQARIFGIIALASLASAATFCPDGKWLRSDRTCQDCPLGCNLCNAINDQPNCISCNFDKAIDISGPVGVCVDCAKGCEVCNGPKPEHCIRAEPGFGPKTGTKELIKCPKTCKYCSSDYKCSSCRYGYFLENERCVECPSYCTECKKEKPTDAEPKCLKCNPGSYLTAKGYCNPCEYQCVECSEVGCIKANPFYHYLKDHKPVECPSNCKVCGADGKCTECVPGWGVRSSEGTCEKCSTFKPGCNACKDGKCTGCETMNSVGIFYNLINGECVECPRGCHKCTDSKTCTKCLRSLVLQNDKTCKSFDIYACKEMGDTIDKCRACDDKYRLSDDGTKCNFINCPSGQGLNAEGLCVPITILNCKKSDERDKRCAEPATGYYAVGSETKPCPKGCSKCALVDSKAFCFEAAKAGRSNYALIINDGVVGTCHSSCGTCTKIDDPKSCDTCRPGYVVGIKRSGSNVESICIDPTIECAVPKITSPYSSYCDSIDPPNGTTSPASKKKSIWNSFVDFLWSWRK
eukprot:TRINITY_DN2907_c0_g1_i6.p1 TRINITY_DN2907_c0_g1~~TRINITY_DN2907_c0_g1_i6.p1  ORF type:complete len:521 (-),score=37.15 TRINITY_DN2907_c0_g1_i6:95-1657(-)